MNDEPLVSFRRLGRSFQGQGLLVGDGLVRAVRDIDLDIAAGRTLGVVGESGCGKSTLGRMAVGLLEPSAGDVFIMGKPLYDKKAHADYAAFRRGLAGKIQMIFQDPYSSLNPRMTVGQIIEEGLITHKFFKRGSKRMKPYVFETMNKCGLQNYMYNRYPHQFSGGQRQRISIARALATQHEFLVCDEPTSALDVSVQAQVLNIMKDLQRQQGLTYLFISHNLAVVRHVADQVGVMYLGRLIEVADKQALFSTPQHPYTRMLLDAIPQMKHTGRARTPVQGEVPNPLNPPTGCAFHPRCPHANARCSAERPKLQMLRGVQVACHAVEEGRL